MTPRIFPFIVLFVFIVSVSRAQDYVVTLKGDTLRGKAKILGYERLDKVEIRESATGKKKVFTALEARSVFSNGSLYHTMQLESVGLKYMKLIKKGYLSYYGFRLPNQLAYDGMYLHKMEGQGMEVPNLTFKKSMSDFLGDCEAVKEKLKAGDYGKRDLEIIIDEYNQCKGAAIQKANVPVAIVNDKTQSIDALLKKLDAAADFTGKKDAQDILKDMRNKSSRNESIPNYLLEGLKANLSSQPDLTTDLNSLLALLQK